MLLLIALLYSCWCLEVKISNGEHNFALTLDENLAIQKAVNSVLLFKGHIKDADPTQNWVRASGFRDTQSNVVITTVRIYVTENGVPETYMGDLIQHVNGILSKVDGPENLNPNFPTEYSIYKLSDVSAIVGPDSTRSFCGQREKPFSAILPQLGSLLLNSNVKSLATPINEEFQCPMYITLHKTWVDYYGGKDLASRYAAVILNEIQGIVENQIKVNLSLLDIYPIEDADHPSGLGNLSESSHNHILDLMISAIKNKNMGPNYDQFKSVCIHHTMSHISNPGVLGLAEVGNLCTGNQNVGSSTPVNAEKTYDRSLYSVIMSHELGHQLGSPHDNADNPECSPTHHYLMAPYLPTGINSYFLSKCSTQAIAANLQVSTCLRKGTSLDICSTNPAISNTPSGDRYQACSISYPQSKCQLLCEDPKLPGQCVQVQSIDGTPISINNC